jgi:hypothetical protein
MGISFNGVQWRAGRNTIAVVVGSCSLQECLKLPALRARQTCWRISTFNDIFVEIHQTEISIGQLQFLIAPLYAHNIRTWSIKSLDQTRW